MVEAIFPEFVTARYKYCRQVQKSLLHFDNLRLRCRNSNLKSSKSRTSGCQKHQQNPIYQHKHQETHHMLRNCGSRVAEVEETPVITQMVRFWPHLRILRRCDQKRTGYDQKPEAPGRTPNASLGLARIQFPAQSPLTRQMRTQQRMKLRAVIRMKIMRQLVRHHVFQELRVARAQLQVKRQSASTRIA